jgi:uncharacterized CHY-type Zn-finger protein
MPFIVQCPDTHCRRYMLLEDDQRDATVACLVCRHSFAVNDAEEVIGCPRCQSRLKLPVRSRNQKIQCGSCRHEFLYC